MDQDKKIIVNNILDSLKKDMLVSNKASILSMSDSELSEAYNVSRNDLRNLMNQILIEMFENINFTRT